MSLAQKMKSKEQSDLLLLLLSSQELSQYDVEQVTISAISSMHGVYLFYDD